MSFTRTPARAALRFLLSRSAVRWANADLAASAIVVAPHPDDETLGCGGLIWLKRRAGAHVRLVFMTDGSRSHAALMPEEKLAEIRRAEARAAAGVLGVPERDVVFLGFGDGRLRLSRDEAIRRLTHVFSEYPAEQVFVPYRGDVTNDHVVTYEIVGAAARTSLRPIALYEYPVWVWRRWPWAVRGSNGRLGVLRNLRDVVQWAWALAFRFRSGVRIADALETKRLALQEHRSQMTRLVPDAGWATLADVADGEFLECFFQEVEPFSKRRLPSSNGLRLPTNILGSSSPPSHG